MEFRVLGPFESSIDGTPSTPSATRVRWTLALLLLRANQVVDRGCIIEELWGENPPRRAVTTAQTYIYHLRKMHLRFAGRLGEGEFIETRPPGYLLRCEESEIDAFVFERLSAEGAAAYAAGDAEGAARRLRQALALWRGPVLADITAGPVLTPHIRRLEEVRTRTVRTRILADLRLGRHHELIPELRLAAAEHPVDEWFHEQLMIALSEAGRRAEALDAYRELQRTLDRNLGIEPSHTLQQLQYEVLVGAVRRPDRAKEAVAHRAAHGRAGQRHRRRGPEGQSRPKEAQS
ncbi:AfsR/SARP family transcriptional regulator [Streptomyces stackebrandtii]|uniref:AfsR/SARP family transcriptional regulator n=1 Tax=Streptomyces stackebrandtii TaxID=3051177 RepID=UPI0028DC1B3E|nr:AfsR/SARP family transcriptional regulator [Streptomyces sp. DSM 40976]